MNKTKRHSADARSSTDSVIADRATSMKAGLQQTSRNCDGALIFGRATVDATIQSATDAGRIAEKINSDFHTYSRQAVDDAITTTWAVMGSKSIHEAFELQTGYARTAFENYVGEWTKLGDLLSSTAKDSFLSFQGRVNDGLANTKSNLT